MLHRNFIGSLRKAVRATEGRAVGYGPNDIRYVPRISWADGKPTSTSIDYFALYALRTAYRGALIGANFSAGAALVLKESLNTAAISLAYTAAYHAAGALAALSGRVWIDLPPPSGSTHGSVLIASLTKDNRWTFEGIKNRNHLSWWMQLHEPLRDLDRPVPPYFQELFDHFSVGIFKVNAPIIQVLDARQEGRQDPRRRWELHERVEWLLRQLADTRHIAHYAGLGVDPGYMDAVINGDAYSGSEHLRAQAIANFAAGALCHVGTTIRRVRDTVPLPPALDLALKLGIGSPPFDFPVLPQVQPIEVREVTAKLIEDLRFE